MEVQDRKAVETNKIAPTVPGLSDSKYTARDCQIMFGITCPYNYEKPDYHDYNITKLGSYARFLNIVVNRNGEMSLTLPLWFDKTVCNFTELPDKKDNKGLEKVYEYIKHLEENLSIKKGQLLSRPKTNFMMFNKYLHKIFDKDRRNK